MKIDLRCRCGNVFSASDDAAGESAPCPQCAREVRIPSVEFSLAPEEVAENPWIRFRCECGYKIKAPREWAGRKGNCPKCGKPVVMPQAGELPPAPPKVEPPQTEPASPADSGANMESGIMQVTRETEEVIVEEPAPATPPKPDLSYKREESLFEPFHRKRRQLAHYFEQNRKLTIALSLAAMATGVAIIYLQLITPDEDLDVNRAPAWIEKPADVYFYDVDSQEVFAHTLANPPPILTPAQKEGDQPHGFRAYVFSCGECSPEKWFIGHLETFDLVAREAWARRMRARRRPDMPNADTVPNADLGRYIVDPAEKDKLLDAASPEAKTVLARDIKPCDDGSAPHACEPPRKKR